MVASREDLRIRLIAERRVSSIVLAPVAAVGWVMLALTGILVRVALFRKHRTEGVVALFWALGFALIIWAGVAVLGVRELRAILFALIAGGAIALIVYLRGAALDDLAVGQPGAYHRRLLARRRSGRTSRAPDRARPGRTRELDLAQIKLTRGELRDALFPLEEAERVAVAQRKLDELLEVRELVRARGTRARARARRTKHGAHQGCE